MPGLEFSMSTSLTTIAIAISTTFPIGLDIERTDRRALIDAKTIDHITSGAWDAVGSLIGKTSDPLVTWTAFEALAKGVGLGVAASGEDLAGGLLSGWNVCWLDGIPDHTVCVAALASKRLNIAVVPLWVGEAE
jgi:hypothetical protein